MLQGNSKRSPFQKFFTISSFVLSSVHSTNAERLKSLVGGALLSIPMLHQIGSSTTGGRNTCWCHIAHNVAMQKFARQIYMWQTSRREMRTRCCSSELPAQAIVKEKHRPAPPFENSPTTQKRNFSWSHFVRRPLVRCCSTFLRSRHDRRNAVGGSMRVSAAPWLLESHTSLVQSLPAGNLVFMHVFCKFVQAHTT